MVNMKERVAASKRASLTDCFSWAGWPLLVEYDAPPPEPCFFFLAWRDVDTVVEDWVVMALWRKDGDVGVNALAYEPARRTSAVNALCLLQSIVGGGFYFNTRSG